MRRANQITSVHNPRVGKVLKLRRHRYRQALGLFIAEGPREVGRAMDANLRFNQLYTCPDLLGRHVSDPHWPMRLNDRLDDSVECFEVNERVLRSMTYRANPEGVLAVIEQPNWHIDQLPQVNNQTIYLVAVETTKPGNLGAMVRTADVAGCHAVFAADTAVDAFNPNAIRSSTCAVYTTPTLIADARVVIDFLEARLIRIVAATANPKHAIPHTEANLSGPVAIVVGPEDGVLSDHWLQAADQTGGSQVTVLMNGRSADSLNASVVAGILMFEAQRQHGLKEKPSD